MPTVVARNVVERLRGRGGVSTTSCKKHVLMYPDGSWDDAAKAHTRENITVVGLPETSLNSSYMSDLRTWNQKIEGGRSPRAVVLSTKFPHNLLQASTSNSYIVGFFLPWQSTNCRLDVSHICRLSPMIISLQACGRILKWVVTNYSAQVSYLTNGVSFPIVCDRTKRTATCKYTLTLQFNDLQCETSHPLKCTLLFPTHIHSLLCKALLLAGKTSPIMY
jgi:hypothetical protein